MKKGQIIPSKLVNILRTEKYQLVGRHSAVKKCRWLHNSLVGKEPCYKNKFFGIRSWRCLQMTPSVAHCTLRCLFCWRIQSNDVNIDFDEVTIKKWDDPVEIVDESIKAQKRILSGYKAHPKVRREKYIEALKPKHAAISLAGEPTLYPNIGDLIHEYNRRGFSTFLVTNGTKPEIIKNINEEPSQLYVSVCAPDKRTYNEVCRPQILGSWENLNKTLDQLSSFNCPTVMRLTLLRSLTLKDPHKYANMIERANPTYVEPKAYVYVGMSRRRLKFENMPTYREIKEFGEKISRLTGYKIIDESPISRVVLLSRRKKAIKFT